MSRKVMSIANYYFLPSFWQHLNFTSEKRYVLLRLSKSRSIFWHLYKNGSAAQLGHVSSIGTSDNRKGQCLVNMASGIGLPI